MNIYVSEILCKLFCKEIIYGFSVEQVIISMMASLKDWYYLLFIKMGWYDKMKVFILVEGKFVVYCDFFD